MRISASLIFILLITSNFPQSQPSSKEYRMNKNNMELIADNNVMQCMKNCIKHEGNTSTAKTTCRLRCTNISIPNTFGGEKDDCMSVYKKCRKSCGKKDTSCKKICKKNLTSCT